MQTIGRKRSHRSPPGDTQRICDYCGIPWYRSQLRRDAAGLLACPDDQKGLDVVTLSEGNLAWAASRRNDPTAGMPADGSTRAKDTDVAPAISWNAPSPAPPPNAGPLGVISVPITAWWRGDFFTPGPSGNTALDLLDASGNSNVLQAVGNSLPATQLQTFGSANLPYFGFNGLNTRVASGPKLFSSDSLWMWFVIRQTNWTAGCTLFNCGCTITQQVGSPVLRMQTGGANNSGAPLGTWTRGIASFTTSGTDDLRLGSTQTSNASPGLRIGVQFVLGANGTTGAGPISASIADFQIYQAPPTALEIAALDAYGLARYGNTVAFG